MEHNDILTIYTGACNDTVMEQTGPNLGDNNWDMYTVYNDTNDNVHWSFPSFALIANSGLGHINMYGYFILVTNIENGKVIDNDFAVLEIPSYSTRWKQDDTLIDKSDWTQTWSDEQGSHTVKISDEDGARHFLNTEINTSTGKTRWDAIVDYYFDFLNNITDEVKDEVSNYSFSDKTALDTMLRDICNFHENKFETVINNNKVQTQHSMRIFYSYSRPTFGVNTPDHTELGTVHNDLRISSINSTTAGNKITMWTQRMHGSKKTDWQYLIDSYFKTNGVLELLDANINKWKSQLGAPSFGKHNVILTIPIPCGPSHMTNPYDLEWGELNGEIINFATQDYIDAGYPICWTKGWVNNFYKMHTNWEAKVKALKWYVDTITNEIHNHHYENFDITGLYFIDENLKWNDIWEEIDYTAENWN